jgi:hypothetical protein
MRSRGHLLRWSSENVVNRIIERKQMYYLLAQEREEKHTPKHETMHCKEQQQSRKAPQNTTEMRTA